MKVKRRSRIFAWLLVIALLMSMLPAAVLASDSASKTGKYLAYDSEGNAAEEATLNASLKTITEDNVTMQKNIVKTGENEFNINLIVTTKENLKEIEISPDAAVVLVMDASASMWGNVAGEGVEWVGQGWNGYWHTSIPEAEQRLTMAKASACSFVDSFISGAEEDTRRMVSVVSFNGGATTESAWKNAAESAETLNEIKGAINGIGIDSSTNIDAGLQLAYNLLGADTVKDITARYVVLLTDGQPNAMKSGTGTMNAVNGQSVGAKTAADAAAATADNIENDRKAAVYTLAFASADLECYSETNITYVDVGKGNGQYSWGWKNGGYKYYEDKNGRYNKVETITELTVGEWLATVASGSDFAKNAANGDELTVAFDQISEQIKSLMQAWQVIDPMAEFINYKGIKEGTNANFLNNTLTWNLWLDTPTPSGGDDEAKTYTYSLTYSIELDVAKEHFETGKFYPTNDATKLVYAPNLTNEDGSLNTSASTKTDYFNVPTVKGEVPDVTYSIYYMYQKLDENGKPVYTDEAEPKPVYEIGLQYENIVGKLWADTQVISEKDFSKENYKFSMGSTGAQKLTGDNMVFKLYYTPIPVTVTVEHYLTTYSEVDGVRGEPISSEVLKDTDTYTTGYFKGNTFNNTHHLAYKLLEKSDNDKNVTLSGDTLIKLYYETVSASKTQVSYSATYYSRTNAYTLVDGKYVLTPGTYEEIPGSKVTGKQYHGDSVTVSDKMSDGYTLDTTVEGSDSAYTFTLDKNGDNDRNYYYQKDGAEPAKATLIIEHIYNDTLVSGTNSTTEQEYTNKNVYIGETYSATEFYNAPAGGTWTRDPNTSLSIKIDAETNTLTITYSRDSRVQTGVTVNHHYAAQKWELVDGEYKLVTDEALSGTVTETIQENLGNSAVYYVGGSATAQEKVTFKDTTFTANANNNPTIASLAASGNVIDLYYTYAPQNPAVDTATGKVIHRYETYTTYIDADGKLVKDKLISPGEEVPGGNYDGYVGEYFTITEENWVHKNNTYTSATHPNAEKKLTLTQEENVYKIVYTRYVDKLGDAIPVNVQPIYVDYEWQIVDGASTKVEVKRDETTAPSVLEGSYYLNQKVSASTASYGKEGYTYTADGSTPEITVAETGNTIVLVYEKITDAREPVTITIYNNYIHETIGVNGVSTKDTTKSGPVEVTTGYYVGMDFETEGYAIPNGFGVDAEKAQPAATIKLTEASTEINFHWYKLTDNSQPATVKVNHHYEIVDANEISEQNRSSAWTVSDDEITGKFATQTYVASPNYANGIFEEKHITTVTPSGAIDSTVGITLVKGENVIDIYYVKNINTSTYADVKVTHIYEMEGFDGAPNVAEGSYPVNDRWQIGKDYPAALLEKNPDTGLTYEFVKAVYGEDTAIDRVEGAASIKGVKVGESGLEIKIYYLRGTETTGYTVKHEYYVNGNLNDTVTSAKAGKIGEEIKAEDIEKITAKDGRNYSYTGASADSIVLLADADSNVITLRYNRTTGGNNPGGNNPGGNTEEDLVDIIEEETPLAPGFEPELEVADDVIIIDEEVPLGELPFTGLFANQTNPVLALGLIASALMLAFFGLYLTMKRKDEAAA